MDLIERYLKVPSGLEYGKPLKLTDRQIRYIVRLHRVHPETGRFHYRRGILEGPKGDGKSPIAGAVAFAHLVGPVVFDGWDANGEPVGRPHPTPWIQVAALAEDQTDNCYMQLRAALGESDALDEFGIDLGLTRIFVQKGLGKIEPVTSVGGTREGQPITFAVKEETQYWVPSRGGDRLSRTLDRNLAKTGGLSLAVTNAFREGEESVAESDRDAAAKHTVGVLYQAFRADPVEDLSDRDAVRVALDQAYDPQAVWLDRERLVDEVGDDTVPPGERRRFYFNQPDRFEESSWLPDGQWEQCRRAGRRVNLDQPFVAALDMALKHDTVAVRWGQWRSADELVVEGREWEPAGEMVDIDDVEAFLIRLASSGHLVEVAYDPAYFERSAQALRERGLNMMEFPQSNERMVPACGTAYELICGGKVVHDDGPRSAQQVLNGTSHPAGEGWRLRKSKVTKGKIDSAIALVMLLARLTALDSTPEIEFVGGYY